MSKILSYLIIFVRSTYNYYSLLALKFYFFISNLENWFNDDNKKELLSDFRVNILKKKLNRGHTFFVFLVRVFNLFLLILIFSVTLTIVITHFYVLIARLNFLSKDVILTEMTMRNLGGNYTKKLDYIKKMNLFTHFHWYLLNSSIIDGSYSYFILNVFDFFSMHSLIRYGESINYNVRGNIFYHQHVYYFPKTICIYTFLVDLYTSFINVPKHINYILLLLQISVVFVESVRFREYINFVRTNITTNTSSYLVLLIIFKSLFRNIYLNLKIFNTIAHNRRKFFGLLLNSKKYIFRSSFNLYNFCILKRFELHSFLYQWKPTSKRTPYFKSIKKN